MPRAAFRILYAFCVHVECVEAVVQGQMSMSVYRLPVERTAVVDELFEEAE